jgi:hypothetical protein
MPIIINYNDNFSYNQIIGTSQKEIMDYADKQIADNQIKSATYYNAIHVGPLQAEALILRILRRIRETGENECIKELRIKNKDVIFMCNGNEIKATEDGDFYTPWPGGFFEWRAGELF